MLFVFIALGDLEVECSESDRTAIFDDVFVGELMVEIEVEAEVEIEIELETGIEKLQRETVDEDEIEVGIEGIIEE